MENSPLSQCCPRLAFSLLVLALSGCWVGRVSVSLPDRLPPQDLPPLGGPITFDVCLPPTAVTPRVRLGSAEGELSRSRVSVVCPKDVR